MFSPQFCVHLPHARCYFHAWSKLKIRNQRNLLIFIKAPFCVMCFFCFSAFRILWVLCNLLVNSFIILEITKLSELNICILSPDTEVFIHHFFKCAFCLPFCVSSSGTWVLQILDFFVVSYGSCKYFLFLFSLFLFWVVSGDIFN